ncbi:MAG: PHP domain-containing protein [Porticoccaceae bacterium]|nr:PHP domain-containing protein [Porticoccaceae bacterium]
MNDTLYDLHCHSTASDGSLTPGELVQRAHNNGVTHLAITDHDTIDAYRLLNQANCPLRLIPGIEFSTIWNKRGVHVVGLAIDLHSGGIADAVKQQGKARQQRAQQIADKLSRRGLHCPLAEVEKIANSSQPGRPHFARYLVESGQVADSKQAFKKYLGDGKPGDVKQHWASLEQVIQWITSAGGIAVLAHPLKYKLTRTKLLALVGDFKALGGQAMEVVSGKQVPADTREMAAVCNQADLSASCGSDFHHPDAHWSELGSQSPLPPVCRPIFPLLEKAGYG